MRLKLIILTIASTLCAWPFLCSAQELAPKNDSNRWLQLLNEQPGRENPLTIEQVRLVPISKDSDQDLIVVGFYQTDGTLVLGDIIWRGTLYTPLNGVAAVLRDRGFNAAPSEQATSMLFDVFSQVNLPLGITLYDGNSTPDENRPQPPIYERQASGYQRYIVWFCQEPGQREGPEWRQVLYIIDPGTTSITVRTLQVYHPAAEGLKGFPDFPLRQTKR